MGKSGLNRRNPVPPVIFYRPIDYGQFFIRGKISRHLENHKIGSLFQYTRRLLGPGISADNAAFRVGRIRIYSGRIKGEPIGHADVAGYMVHKNRMVLGYIVQIGSGQKAFFRQVGIVVPGAEHPFPLFRLGRFFL